MSHPSKVKGNFFEREVVSAAKAEGLEAVRAWGSNGAALGKDPEVDLMVDVYAVQAKRRKKLPSYLQIPECCDAVVFRQDRGETLVLTRLDDWLHMIKQVKGIQ